MPYLIFITSADLRATNSVDVWASNTETRVSAHACWILDIKARYALPVNTACIWALFTCTACIGFYGHIQQWSSFSQANTSCCKPRNWGRQQQNVACLKQNADTIGSDISCSTFPNTIIIDRCIPRTNVGKVRHPVVYHKRVGENLENIVPHYTGYSWLKPIFRQQHYTGIHQFDKQPKAFVRPRAHRFTVESADT